MEENLYMANAVHSTDIGSFGRFFPHVLTGLLLKTLCFYYERNRKKLLIIVGIAVKLKLIRVGHTNKTFLTGSCAPCWYSKTNQMHFHEFYSDNILYVFRIGKLFVYLQEAMVAAASPHECMMHTINCMYSKIAS